MTFVALNRRRSPQSRTPATLEAHLKDFDSTLLRRPRLIRLLMRLSFFGEYPLWVGSLHPKPSLLGGQRHVQLTGEEALAPDLRQRDLQALVT